MIIDPAWLPNATLKRIIVHWTAGAHTPNSNDLGHYHFLIPNDGRIVRGQHPVTHNSEGAPIGSAGHPYAAHTYKLNSGSIGIAMCGMEGADVGKLGKYPLNQAQWDAAVELCAILCRRYGIGTGIRDILGHCEVKKVYGIDQLSKWDPWYPFPGIQETADLPARNWAEVIAAWPVIGGRFREHVTQELAFSQKAS